VETHSAIDGSVVKESKLYRKKVKDKKAVKYVLRHSAGLTRVLQLTNGKFRTSTKLTQLVTHGYEARYGLRLKPKDVRSCLTNNHWLAGFTDADGCFYISVVFPKDKTHTCGKGVRLEYKITQKYSEILESVRAVFGGIVSPCFSTIRGGTGMIADQNYPMYRYNSTSFKSAIRVIHYFDRFHCQSPTKLIAYFKWRKVYRIIQRKQHLTPEGLNQILRIRNTGVQF
jgi:hypothetical protein